MATRFSDRKKIAAVEAINAGGNYRDVCKRYKCTDVSLRTWRKQYAEGKFGNASDATAETPVAKGKTPEALFDDRVRQAVILLRHAEAEVERMKQQKKLKEPDAAHLYAQLALRLLQGDNGR